MDYKSITTEELEQMVRQKGQKDGEALCELGERYLYGKNGTMANPTKAGRLFEKAEKLGEKRAYAGLAEMYHKGIFFIKNEDIAREYYAKAGMSFPQNEPPQPDPSEPPQYVSPGHQSADSQIAEMEILDLIRDAKMCREKEDYETAKRICGSLLQQLNDIRVGQMGYQGGRSVDELEAEVKWVLAYVSYNEQRYDDMEQLLMQPQVLEKHPWGTYLIALGHRMQQSDNNQMSQDLQMLIQNSQNINLTREEKGDINVMIASLLSEGYGNAIGMSLQDAGMYYQEAANCGNEYAKEQLACF